MLELRWKAKFADGSTISELGEGCRNHFIDLKQNGLRQFALFEQDSGEVMASVDVTEGQKVFYRCRSFKPIGSPEVVGRVWFLGWRQRVDGNITQKITVIYPNKQTETFDTWGVKPFLTEPKPEDWFPEEIV